MGERNAGKRECLDGEKSKKTSGQSGQSQEANPESLTRQGLYGCPDTLPELPTYEPHLGSPADSPAQIETHLGSPDDLSGQSLEPAHSKDFPRQENLSAQIAQIVSETLPEEKNSNSPPPDQQGFVSTPSPLITYPAKVSGFRPRISIGSAVRY